jgi:hypothetical protein
MNEPPIKPKKTDIIASCNVTKTPVNKFGNRPVRNI